MASVAVTASPHSRIALADGARRILLVVASVAALVAVIAVCFSWLSAAAYATALERAVVSAERLAVSTIAPAVDDAVHGGDEAAIAALDALVAARKSDGSLVRVKVWDFDGRIVYSDEPALIGRRFSLPGEELGLLASGGSSGGLMREPARENLFETGLGPLVEVYSVATSGTGKPLLFESYVPAEDVDAVQREFVVRVAPVLLVLVMLPVSAHVWWVRRNRRALAARERALTHSTAASALHRHRIARRLRDEVLQGMAGVGYALESLSPQLPSMQRPLADKAASAVQQDLAKLRHLVDGLEDDVTIASTMQAAVERVSDALRNDGVPVDIELSRSVAVNPGTAGLVHHLVAELSSTALVRRPTHVAISITSSRGLIRIGLDVEGAYRCDGLAAVRSAVAHAGGSFAAEPQTDSRSRVGIELPIR
jgi:two-component system, NarL family, sensor kinase